MINQFAVVHKPATWCRSVNVFPSSTTNTTQCLLLYDVYKWLIHTRGKTDKYAQRLFVRFGVSELLSQDSLGLSETFSPLLTNELQPPAWKVSFCKVPVVVERMQCFPTDATCQAAERKWEFGASCDADHDDPYSTDSKGTEEWKKVDLRPLFQVLSLYETH